MQEWREIVRFPGYSVSGEGLVRNDETDRVLRQTPNNRGIATVGLMYRGMQYKRSVAVLVADAFILTARSIEFDTPINMDGDRFNNHKLNLAWRPRWFAIKYFKQFIDPIPTIDMPVENLDTGEIFEDSWKASTSHGLLDRTLAMSIATRTRVWPTYHHYQVLK